MKQMVEELCAHTISVLPHEELEQKLSSGKPLIVKLGADPTAPDLHLGHAVVLRKMKQFQDLGHEVVFLIGDFTARIGDPTGRSKTRPPLTDEQIQRNSETYFAQVGRILNPARISIRYNSEWLSTLSSADWIKLCAQVTLARLIEREDFAKRLHEHVSIGFHELLYPLLQAYDSVSLKADVELGGTDQTFNLLMGRTLQECYNMSAQVIMTMPLLEGIDGGNKMSKSQHNTIGLTEAPDQAYGKLMSISDTLMWHYYHVLLQVPENELAQLKEAVKRNEVHPMELKKRMAHAIITEFWSAPSADSAQQQFEQLFQQKNYEQVSSISLAADTPNPIWIVDLLKRLNACSSSSEARRLIEAGAVTVDGIRITNTEGQLQWKSGTLIKVGKHRFYRIAE